VPPSINVWQWLVDSIGGTCKNPKQLNF
jgi:hypothetical protein